MARLEEKFRERAQGKSPGAPTFNPLPQQRDTLVELPLFQIETDPNQPRKDLGDLAELKASIEAVGLVQPIIVTISDYERYRIIAGERRFTAARELGLAKIPSIVRSVEDHERLELQIVENLHRKDLNPFEEAQSYRRLMDDFGLTQEDIGKRLGRSQVSINETLRLLSLPSYLREEYRTSNKISKSLLLEIAKQPEEEQLALWERARQGELTVRKARERKRQVKGNEAKVSQPQPAAMVFRYQIQTEEAVVTVVFKRPQASLEEIVKALEEAVRAERERLLVVGND